MPRRGPIRTCTRCQRPRVHCAHGLCRTCYHNGRHPYIPTGTGPGGRGVPKTLDDIAGRVADFQILRDRGLSIKAAAAQLGISERTGDRYATRLRTQQGAA